MEAEANKPKLRRRRRPKPRHARRSLPGQDSKHRGSKHKVWLVASVSTIVLLLAATLSLALTAGTRAVGSVAAPSTTSSVVPPPCPLSGMPAPGGQVPQRPALVVKVDNYPDARPQAGLDIADIVFEEPVEGGITRFAAVFQCQDANQVGPIRSAREVDAQILDLFSTPIFVHVGGIAPVLSIISNAKDYDQNIPASGSSIVQNLAGRYAPYDTYISTKAGWGLRSSDTSPPAPVFTYSAFPPSGTAVSSLHIPFSQTSDVTWTWDASREMWMRSYGGTRATVSDGGQIAASNVVIETVHITYGPWAENNVGGVEVQSQMTGSGPVAVLRNGIEETGTWQRSSIDAPTRLVASDGSTIPLRPGETWVELVPSSIGVTTTSPPGAAATSTAATSKPGSSRSG